MNPARLVMPLVFVAWAGACAALGALRPEHVVLAVVAPTMAWASPRSGDLFAGLTSSRSGCSVSSTMQCAGSKDALEGAAPGADRAADVRRVRGAGTPHHGLFRAFGWTFLALNVAGFATYHLYPAAPPWYVQERGCLVDLSAHASEGPNLARVDAWLGIGWFHAFYGRSSDVFGAVPSLHVAYPLLCLLFGWRTWRAPGRVLGASFFDLMCFAAVYLAHHWVTDVVVGVVFTLVAAGAASFRRRPADGRELRRAAAAGDLARTPGSSRGPRRAET